MTVLLIMNDCIMINCMNDYKQRDKIKTTLEKSNPGLSVWL